MSQKHLHLLNNENKSYAGYHSMLKMDDLKYLHLQKKKSLKILALT